MDEIARINCDEDSGLKNNFNNFSLLRQILDKKWKGNDIPLSYAFSYKNNSYFCYYYQIYKLNTETNEIEECISYNTPYFGINCYSYIWNDGENLYYSGGNNKHYKFNEETNTWEKMTWNGFTDFLGWYIKIAGDDAYFAHDGDIYKLNKDTNTWENIGDKGIESMYVDTDYIWSDGENLYYSYSYISRNQYKLNKETNTWEEISWNCNKPGMEYITAKHSWVNGEDVYILIDRAKVFKLNKSTNTWEYVSVSPITDLVNAHFMTLNGKSYCFSTQGNGYYYWYRLDEETNNWERIFWKGDAFFLYGSYIWYSGKDIYYSERKAQYKLDKKTNIWNPVEEWQNNIPFDSSEDLWIDKDYNIYVLYNEKTYKLNKTTNVWEEMSWNWLYDVTSIAYNCNTQYLWYDINKENLYFSYSSTHKKINIEKEEIKNITWNGLTNFDGNYIWNDGENIYYSNDTNQYKLNKKTNVWEKITWNGLTNFNAEEIWSDENNIYYSNDTEQYKLNKETNTWEEMTWDIDFYGSLIWTDGENLYYSSSSKQKIFMSLDNNNNNLFDKEHRGQLINNIFIHGLALDKDDNLIYRGHDNNFYKIEGKVLGGYLNEEYRS